MKQISRNIPIKYYIDLLFGTIFSKFLIPLFSISLILCTLIFKEEPVKLLFIFPAIPFVLFLILCVAPSIRTIILLRNGILAIGSIEKKERTLIANQGLFSAPDYFYKYTFSFIDLTGNKRKFTQWALENNEFEKLNRKAILFNKKRPRQAIALGLIHGNVIPQKDNSFKTNKLSIVTYLNFILFIGFVSWSVFISS